MSRSVARLLLGTVNFAERGSDIVSDERLFTYGENVAWNGYSASCDCDMSVDNKLPGVLGGIG